MSTTTLTSWRCANCGATTEDRATYDEPCFASEHDWVRRPRPRW